MRMVFICAEDEIPGVCYLSAYLKKHGQEVLLVFEPRQFNRAYIRNEFLAKILSREKDNLQRLKEISPDLIGFSCTTAHYQWALAFAKKVKKSLPKIPIIFGGVHPTLVPELVMKNKAVDFVCQGEGEKPLLELLVWLEKGNKAGVNDCLINNIWYRKDNLVIKNPLRPLLQNLDDLPFIDKGFFENQLPPNYREYSYFFTSRGCPYNCTYCGNEQMRKLFFGLGRYVRRMSPKRAIEELTFIKKKYGAKYILFEDDIFATDEKWLSAFIPLYKKNVNLPFTCFGHVKLLTPKIVELLKQGGCDLLWFGLQSANEKIRREVFQRYETNEEIIRAADLCHKEKIKFMVDHILNVPYDTHEAIKEALWLYHKIRPLMINCYNLLYFPKAKINDIALEAGMIKKADIKKINEGEALVYQTGDFTKYNNFYSRYAFLITSIPLMSDLVIEKIQGSERLINAFNKIPLLFIPLIKIIINFKIGRGFLPLSILRTELFFTKKYIIERLNFKYKSLFI